MALYGLRTWDEGGNLTLDTTDYIGKVLGTQLVSTFSSGQIVVNTTGNQRPFAVVQPFSSSPAGSIAISILGNIISWSYNSVSGISAIPMLIVYGVY